MQQHAPHNKATPGRRRQNRHPNTSPAVKTYASENDMLSDLQFPLEMANGGPYTPQKSASNSPAPSSHQAAQRQNPRSSNRSRPKHDSPGPAAAAAAAVKHGRNTPPSSVAQKPIAAAAFAGATFHASPAPSSLPIPSWLAKPPDSPGIKDAVPSSQEPSPPVTDSEAPTPHSRQQLGQAAREESPLDLFFRADRAEKERARRASSANVLASAPGPFSPPSEPQLPAGSNSAPRGPENRRGQLQRTTSTGILPQELDGAQGQPIGPAFSTPYQERIRAARSAEKQPQSATQPPVSPSTDRTEALKNFLFNGQLAVPHTSPPPNFGGQPSVPSAARQFAPVQGIQAAETGRSRDVVLMEDNLRRILKLDSLRSA